MRIAIAVVCVFLGLVAGCDSKSPSGPVDDTHVVVLTKDNFQTEVLESKQPVMVDFWATWCGPCRMLAPTVGDLATEFNGKVKVGKLDVDTAPEIAKKYSVSAIPTLIFFKDGKQVDQAIGVLSKEDLRAKLNKLAPEQKAAAQ